MIKRWLTIVLITATLAAGGSYYWLLWWAEQPLDNDSPIVLQVPSGQSLIALSKRLEQQELLWARPWLLYARINQRTAIKAGEYEIAAHINPRQLLEQLIAGQVIQYRAQILEGWTYAEALEYLQGLDYLDNKLAGLDWKAQRQLLGMEWAEHPEGWFFPDTYHYSKGDSDVKILAAAQRKMTTLLEQLWEDRSDNLPYRSPYEALIMASIVEKETAIDEEREQIAGVFVRRLQKGMRLQTDPTIIYGLGSRYNGNIRKKDLQAKTPYNTYQIAGLPPTPIALPGARSLYAALHPDQGKSLYFVAKGNGYHQFSDTLEQHNEAVRKYQLQRVQGYRSVPARAQEEKQ